MKITITDELKDMLNKIDEVMDITAFFNYEDEYKDERLWSWFMSQVLNLMSVVTKPIWLKMFINT